MRAYQWFLLGMMFAWTPSLLVLAVLAVLAVMLRRSDRDDSEVRTL
jgi:hypothetical protein